MTYRRILVATDGSSRGRAAAEEATRLAQAVGATLTGLFVVDETSYLGLPSGFDWDALSRALREEGERALAGLAETARAAGVAATTRLEQGHPAEVIVEAAKDHDLLVIGTLGRTGLAHLLLGSIAERVVRHATCPVLVVRSNPV